MATGTCSNMAACDLVSARLLTCSFLPRYMSSTRLFKARGRRALEGDRMHMAVCVCVSVCGILLIKNRTGGET